MNAQQFSDDAYEGQVFKGLTLDYQEIRGVEFSSCTFIKCSFKEAGLIGCRFLDCGFKKCELDLAHVDGSSFRNTRFEASRVIGVNWAEADWGKAGARQVFKSVDFFECVLNYSSFAGLALARISMRRCTAREVDFSEAILRQADCAFTDFAGSQFRHTDLSEANFAGATNYSIHPQMNILKQTKFSLPEALSLLYNLDICIVEESDEETR